MMRRKTFVNVIISVDIIDFSSIVFSAQISVLMKKLETQIGCRHNPKQVVADKGQIHQIRQDLHCLHIDNNSWDRFIMKLMKCLISWELGKASQVDLIV